MENKLFSFVIPVYGAQEYLSACVESLLAQTYKNIEIILVDDGSPDNCPAICDEFAKKDSRVKVIHKENGGATIARTVGAEAASGEYICCIDADDYVSRDYIEKFAKAAAKTGADMLCCGHFIARGEELIERPLPDRKGLYWKEQIETEIFPKLIQTVGASYFAPSLWGKAIKKELFLSEQREIPTELKIGEDGACIIPCVYRANTLVILPECLYFYRVNPQSITKNGKAFRFDGPRLIAEHLEKRIDTTHFDFKEQMHRKTVHELFTVVKSQFNRKEKYSVIIKDIKENLENPLYAAALKNARFTSLSGRLAHAALKYRLYPLIWLFNKIG